MISLEMNKKLIENSFYTLQVEGIAKLFFEDTKPCWNEEDLNSFFVSPYFQMNEFENTC